MGKVIFKKDGQFCPESWNSKNVYEYKKDDTAEFDDTVCKFLVDAGIASYEDKAKAQKAQKDLVPDDKAQKAQKDLVPDDKEKGK